MTSRCREYSDSSISYVTTPLDRTTSPLSPYSQYSLDSAIYPSPRKHRKHQTPWMQSTYPYENPLIRVENIHDFDFASISPYDHSFDNTHAIPHEWQMYRGGQDSVGSAVQTAHQTTGYHRNRGHQRQASDSTIASAGPDSPFASNTTHPFIVNTDRSPAAAYYHSDDGAATYGGKSSADQFPSFPVGYLPSQLSHTPAAHSAMKDMAIDHHNTADDVPDFASSRHSAASSHGRNTPSTPRLGTNDDSEEKPFKIPSNDYPRPRVELYRTESAACQDELYNPANFTPSSQQISPQQPQPQRNDLLSPHRNLVNERVRTANSVRSQSPAQLASGARSPFRQGSPLAPTEEFHRSSRPTLGTASAARQQQKEQADAREYAVHQPQLRREATKTMSPQDALLDYNDGEQDNSLSLFSDNIPAGYQRHYGGSELYPNNYVSGTNQAFGQYTTPNQANITSFRTADGSAATADFNFVPSTQASANTYSQQRRPFTNSLAATEQTPEFPAQLTSMESSMSENAPASSQETGLSPVARPAKTTADSGSYTCTQPGCTLRFESSAKLVKHKREAHQAPREATSTPSVSTGSESPADIGSSMSSSALLARNSQTGPHKCARINPSTGKPCNSIFSRPYDLTRHEDTIHNRGKQKVRCQYCREEKSFSRNDALTRHMRVVHPEIDFQGKRGRRDY